MFTTTDPIELNGGLNLHQYASSPISWIDSWGGVAPLVNMGKVHFIYQDSNRLERRSDGLTFVIAPKLAGEGVCVYCNEYDSFALSINDFERSKFIPASKSINFRSAQLAEICDQGLAGFVNLISAYDVGNNQYKYIDLTSDQSVCANKNRAFYVFKSKDGVEVGIFCKIPQFFDEKIYFYSVSAGCFWRNSEGFGTHAGATKFKGDSISPVSLSNIYEAGYLDLVVGVKDFLPAHGKLVESEFIDFRQSA